MKVLHGIRAALKRTHSKRSAKFICIGNARSVWSARASAPLSRGDLRKHSTFNIQPRTFKVPERGSVSRSNSKISIRFHFPEIVPIANAAAGHSPALLQR